MQHLIIAPVESPRVALFMEECDRLMEVETTGEKKPYITLHRPFDGIEAGLVRRIVESEVSNVTRKPVIQLDAIRPFGLRHITLPVVAPLALSRLWTNLHTRLSRQTGYRVGPYDEENTLHITAATLTPRVHGKVWPVIRDGPFRAQLAHDPIVVKLRSVELRQRNHDGELWRTIHSFPFGS